jgi:hypothetical protein
VKCSWGGCQTEAVVRCTPAEPMGWGEYDDEPDMARHACRFHMAVICEERKTHIVESLARVTDKEEP